MHTQRHSGGGDGDFCLAAVGRSVLARGCCGEAGDLRVSGVTGVFGGMERDLSPRKSSGGEGDGWYLMLTGEGGGGASPCPGLLSVAILSFRRYSESGSVEASCRKSGGGEGEASCLKLGGGDGETSCRKAWEGEDEELGLLGGAGKQLGHSISSSGL